MLDQDVAQPKYGTERQTTPHTVAELLHLHFAAALNRPRTTRSRKSRRGSVGAATPCTRARSPARPPSEKRHACAHLDARLEAQWGRRRRVPAPPAPRLRS
eukprot:413751-Prymnesium_polylepis.1